MWKFLFKFLISRIDIIIFVSSYIKNKFKKNVSIKKINNIILNNAPAAVPISRYTLTIEPDKTYQ